MRWNHDKNRNILAVARLQSQLVFDSAQVHVLKKKDLVSDLSWVSSDTRREFSYLAGQPLDLTSSQTRRMESGVSHRVVKLSDASIWLKSIVQGQVIC